MATSILVKFKSLDDAHGAKLYLLCFGIFCMSWGMECIDFVPPIREIVVFISNIVTGFVALILGFLAFRSALSWGRMKAVALAAIGVVLVISGLIAHAYYLVWAYLFVLAVRPISARDLACVVFVVSCCLLLVSLTCSIGGFTNGRLYSRGDSARFSLGFVHPNMVARFVLTACLSWSILIFGRAGRSVYIAFPILALIVYMVSGSRTGFLMIVFLTGLYALASSSFGDVIVSWRFRAGIASAVTVLCLASLILSVFYDGQNQVMLIIDKALSGRLSFPHQLLANAPISLFGFDLADSYLYVAEGYLSEGATTVPVDNVFCALFIRFGVVSMFIFLGYLIYPLLKRGFSPSKELVFGLMVCAIVGMSEAYVFDITFNFFLLVAASELLQSSGQIPRCDVLVRRATGKHFRR